MKIRIHFSPVGYKNIGHLKYYWMNEQIYQWISERKLILMINTIWRYHASLSILWNTHTQALKPPKLSPFLDGRTSSSPLSCRWLVVAGKAERCQPGMFQACVAEPPSTDPNRACSRAETPPAPALGSSRWASSPGRGAISEVSHRDAGVAITRASPRPGLPPPPPPAEGQRPKLSHCIRVKTRCSLGTYGLIHSFTHPMNI